LKKVIKFTVNGKSQNINIEKHRVLLQVLREELGMTGTKYGCGEGQCGACTVLIDGRAVRSCVYPPAQAENKSIITIEGLEKNGKLHPVQDAFIEKSGMQCGYCTPGMILKTIALLEENPDPSDSEIVEEMNRNICRCCNYPNIISAVRLAAVNFK
jgi:aerobic-type carbon monoxide dehydrogenase small subunit (CoxS/CutS family)